MCGKGSSGSSLGDASAAANAVIGAVDQRLPVRALEFVSSTVAAGGKVLFVGTKRQAQDQIADAAKRSAQYYINSRWLGGTLTNWKTITGSIKRLRTIEETLAGRTEGLTKKEILEVTRDHDKLERSLGGIKDMNGLPDVMFVIDSSKEAIAVEEARKLGIQVVAVVDTNCDPDKVDYVIPGNDDALRAIRLFTNKIADAVVEGRQLATEQDFSAEKLVTDESAPVEDMSQYAQYVDPKFSEQLMSESMPEEDLPPAIKKAMDQD